VVAGASAGSPPRNDAGSLYSEADRITGRGGGYYDSGYVQQLDFFGDGTRIPLIVVSRFTQGGHINHTYTDHVSTLKFIEANWGLSPITTRSRDNLPNPITTTNAYVPTNRPAIGDLMDMFNFGLPHP